MTETHNLDELTCMERLERAMNTDSLNAFTFGYFDLMTRFNFDSSFRVPWKRVISMCGRTEYGGRWLRHYAIRNFGFPEIFTTWKDRTLEICGMLLSKRASGNGALLAAMDGLGYNRNITLGCVHDLVSHSENSVEDIDYAVLHICTQKFWMPSGDVMPYKINQNVRIVSELMKMCCQSMDTIYAVFDKLDMYHPENVLRKAYGIPKVRGFTVSRVHFADIDIHTVN